MTTEALAARYEAVKTRRFGSPERRTIEQIAFPDEAAARAALDKLRAGTAFAPAPIRTACSMTGDPFSGKAASRSNALRHSRS